MWKSNEISSHERKKRVGVKEIKGEKCVNVNIKSIYIFL